MLRRSSRTGSETRGGAENVAPERSPEEDAYWSGWAEGWGAPEEERVARWLTGKGRAASAFGEGDQGDGEPVSLAWPSAGDFVDVAELESRDDVRLAASGGLAERHQARTLVEAQIAHLEDERRRLAESLEAERLEADRIRHDQVVARSRLEAEIARLDEQRRRLLSTAEAAASAAEQAVGDEHRARAALEAARAEAKRVEAKQFETWVALEAEITALREERRRLGGHPEASDRATSS